MNENKQKQINALCAAHLWLSGLFFAGMAYLVVDHYIEARKTLSCLRPLTQIVAAEDGVIDQHESVSFLKQLEYPDIDKVISKPGETICFDDDEPGDLQGNRMGVYVKTETPRTLSPLLDPDYRYIEPSLDPNCKYIGSIIREALEDYMTKHK